MTERKTSKKKDIEQWVRELVKEGKPLPTIPETADKFNISDRYAGLVLRELREEFRDG